MTLLLVGVALSLYLVQLSQDDRSRASASTRLYFLPNSSQAVPITADPGDTLSLDVMIVPGQNLVSGVRLIIAYDPQKFAPVSEADPFTVNAAVFKTTLQKPTVFSGRLMLSVSINADKPTEALQTQDKVGTLKLRVLERASGGVTPVTFGPETIITAVDAGSGASENVLSSSQPALVSIAGQAPTNTPTPPPADTPTPTPSVSMTPTSTPKPGTPTTTTTNTPPPKPGDPSLQLTAIFHAIGAGGDNVDSNNSGSNKNPKHTSRPFTLELYTIGGGGGAEKPKVITLKGNLTYDKAAGTYTASVNSQSVPGGDYRVRLKVDSYLARSTVGAVSIRQNQQTKLPPFVLITGDVNNDNKLSLLDYNLIASCYAVPPVPTACKADMAQRADLDDDGDNDEFDTNYFIRELSIQTGDL